MATATKKAARKSSSRQAVAPTAKEPKYGRPIMPAVYGMGKRKKGTMKWADACKKLEKSRNYWITTAREDGRAHAMPVWGFWMDDAVFFGTGRESIKGKNLVRTQHAIVHLESAEDLVVLECDVSEADLSNEDLRTRLDKASRAKYKMPLFVDAESAIFRATPRVALAWREKDFPKSATRFVFQ